jgi:serine phosphatase RsbU (regulator of sigma subunit)
MGSGTGGGSGRTTVTAVLTADQLASLLETNTSGFMRLDRDWRFTYVNAQAEVLLRRSRGDLLRTNIWAEFPAGAESEWFRQYQEAFDTGREVTFEAYLEQLGAWFEVRATPDALGLSVFLLDVTARRRAYDRLALIADITSVLVGDRDVESVAATLARSVIPALGAWALVSLYDDDGRLYEAAAFHGDSELGADLRLLEQLHPRLISDMGIVAIATASGEPQRRTGLAGHISAGAASGNELFRTLDRLGCDSVVMLPLRTRSRTLGVLSLFKGVDDCPMGEDETATIVAVADQAALALENAQLYSHQRRAAEVLQRSLLTPLPQPDRLQLVARYLPAADGTEVGGDWYDAFLQPDGSTVLVIGDIVGHDISAAAGMGQLRNLLRGTAYDRRDSPAELLVRLDSLITGLGIDSLATLLVGRIEPPDSQGARVFRWSNAGHTPPMTRHGNRVDVFEPESDLLLGIDSQLPRQEHSTTLYGGGTLLLYTDGLIERRKRSLTEGIAELALAFSVLEMSPLDQACDELLARMLTERPFDDVALLAVRVTS